MQIGQTGSGWDVNQVGDQDLILKARLWGANAEV